MKLIAIAGAKNSKKDLLAFRLAKNSDCKWIKPCTDVEDPVNLEDFEQDDLIRLNKEKLDDRIDSEPPVCLSEVNGHRYVFFPSQLTASYCVILADDRVIMYLKDNWTGDLVTVKCHSNSEKHSNRNLLPDDEFDEVFHYDEDDYDLFEARIQ